MVEGNFTIFQNRFVNGITSKKRINLTIVLRGLMYFRNVVLYKSVDIAI